MTCQDWSDTDGTDTSGSDWTAVNRDEILHLTALQTHFDGGIPQSTVDELARAVDGLATSRDAVRCYVRTVSP